MKHVESLEQHSNLIKEFKERTSCKKPKTNCFLRAEEIGTNIADGNWMYAENDEGLYFVSMDETKSHLYYYVTADMEPYLPMDMKRPVMVDFVLREREIAGFKEEVLPFWEKAGFSLYKWYQRMRCSMVGNFPVASEYKYVIMTAKEGQAGEIRALWNLCLDKCDNRLPSASETIGQIRKGNVICCMDHGRICGTVYTEVNGRSGFIQHVAVHEEYRRQAMGEHMIKYLCGHMFQKGVTDFKLWVDMENVAAIRLYTKNGFKKDGVFSTKLLKK